MIALRTRHRVALAGRVVDELTGAPIEEASVVLSGVRPLPAHTRSRSDGFFWFMDLPNGSYDLAAWLPSAMLRYARRAMTIEITNAESKNPAPVRVEMPLKPTAVRGKVADTGGAGIASAFVRVRGGTDTCYSDRAGEYLLAGVEPGKRELLVSARGFVSASVPLELREPGDQKVLDLKLETEVMRGTS